MVTKTPTPILIDTAILSQIVSDILAEVDAPSTKKSACLNRAAARIAGSKHNWGYLTGKETPVIANGVAGYSVASLSAATADAHTQAVADFPTQIAERNEIIATAFDAGLPLLLIAGVPGDGKFFATRQAAEARGKTITEIRVAEHVGLMTQHGRLRDEFRPQADKNSATVYDEVDTMTDDEIAALNHEVHHFCLEQTGGHIVLLTNNPDALEAKLRENAPGLLNRAISTRVSLPADPQGFNFLKSPMFHEFMEHSAKAVRAGIVETETPRLFTKESWEKAGELIRLANAGSEIAADAKLIADTHEAAALAETGRIPVDVEDLIAFMESDARLSPRVIAFMRSNPEALQAGLDTGDVSPKAWQDLARMVDLLDDCARRDALDEQASYAEVILQFLEARMPQIKAALKAHLDL